MLSFTGSIIIFDNKEKELSEKKAKKGDAQQVFLDSLAVFLGGSAGTACRAGLDFLQHGTWLMPWVTLGINLTGAFILGYLTQLWATREEFSSFGRKKVLFLGTGFLGGFTTYGTFVTETSKMLIAGHSVTASLYVMVSIVFGVLIAGLGFYAADLVSRFSSRRYSPAKERTEKERLRREGKKESDIVSHYRHLPYSDAQNEAELDVKAAAREEEARILEEQGELRLEEQQEEEKREKDDSLRDYLARLRAERQKEGSDKTEKTDINKGNTNEGKE